MLSLFVTQKHCCVQYVVCVLLSKFRSNEVSTGTKGEGLRLQSFIFSQAKAAAKIQAGYRGYKIRKRLQNEKAGLQHIQYIVNTCCGFLVIRNCVQTLLKQRAHYQGQWDGCTGVGSLLCCLAKESFFCSSQCICVGVVSQSFGLTLVCGRPVFCFWSLLCSAGCGPITHRFHIGFCVWSRTEPF